MSTNDSERYNGWTNRETWALMLHINNDEGLLGMFREAATHPYPQDTVREEAENLLILDNYHDLYGEAQPEGLARMASEVGSLWRVDWSEVVASLLED